VGEPGREGSKKVSGGSGEGTFGSLSDGFDADAIGHGDFLDTCNDGRDALGEFSGELAKVTHHGGQADDKEKGECEQNADDEDDDGNGAGGVIATEVERGDSVDDRPQDDGEEGADV
jgi:hypothetical protein